MTKQKIFGTDGVRGTANIEPVTAETALKLGRAAAHVFKNVASKSRSRGRHKIAIGKDTRVSGYMLENAISAGVLSMGVDVLFIGPLPTPGVAYVTRSLRADAGIVITASHNPYDDNGIKFFRADGYKLDDKIEGQIEHLVFSGEIESIRPTASAIGKAMRIDDALGRYIEYAKASFPRRMTLEGLRVVVDCGNGAAYKSTPCVLRELGAEVVVYGDEPDGTNINKECGSMHPDAICAKVAEHRADIGISHDGDADRVLLCDETGALIDGDDVMAIAALDMLANGTLAKKTLVTTVMSNAGLDAVVLEAGGKIIRTAVGDKNVIDEMLREDYNFGGEQSGHLIFRDYSSTGDGLVAALQILQIMKSQDAKLSQLKQCWTRYPQLVTNVKVREKKPFDQLNGLLDLVSQAEAVVKPEGGRVLLRYSGTEQKARLLIEGRDADVLEQWSKRICTELKNQIAPERVKLPYKVATLLYCFNERDEVLLLERAQEPNRGFWSPCGGKVHLDEGESPYACACREAREEIDLHITPADLHLAAVVSEHAYAGQGHWLMFLFEVKTRLQACPPPHPEGVFRFFPREAIGGLHIPQTDRDILWPLFWQHRGGFFAAHWHWHADGRTEWVIEESRPALP